MSTLSQMIGGRDPQKRCILFKKTSTCKVNNLGSYIRKYLDETKKRENRTQTSEHPAFGANVQNRLRHGIDYLTREKRQGALHLYGFLREEVYKESGKYANEMSHEELGNATIAVWRKKVMEKELKKAAHKLVFSLDPEICKMMKLANMPTDEILLGIVEQTFRAYTDEFYPGQALGYMTGIHHDKEHIHAHILLFPQTDQGNPINISHRSKTKVEGRTVRIDYQGFLKSTVEKLAKRMYLERLKKPITTMELPIEYRAQRKMVLIAAVDMAEGEMQAASRKGEAYDKSQFWRQVLGKKRLMEQSVTSPDGAKAYQSALKATYEKRLKSFDTLTTETAQVTLDKAISTKEKMELDMKELAKRSIAAIRSRKEADTPWHAMRKLSRECYRVKKLLFKGKDIKWSVAAFLNDNEGRWYLKRMDKPDRLGKTMRHVFNETSKAFSEAEKQDFQRGGNLSKVKSMVGQGWRLRRETVDRQLAIIERVKMQLQNEAQIEMEAESKTREKEKERKAELSAMIQLMALQILDCTSKLKNKKPLYLRQFEAWKATGQDIPIALTEGIYIGPIDEVQEEDELKNFVSEDRIGARTGSTSLAEKVRHELEKNAPTPLKKISQDELSNPGVDSWTREKIDRVLSGDYNATLDLDW